jgi:hypothetical protein
LRQKCAALIIQSECMAPNRTARIFLAAVTAAGVCVFGAAAASQSLRDLRAQDREDRALDREASYTSEVCGRRIDADIEWSSVRDWPPRESVAKSCDGALSAVETICRAGRKDVVHRFVCAGDGSGASLTGKTLRYGGAPGSNGYAPTLAVIGGAQ